MHIKSLEEQRLDQNYRLNLTNADGDMFKKKLNVAEQEIKDLRYENRDLQIKYDSDEEIISKLKDRIV